MKCPECERTGERSTFQTDGLSLSTAMAGTQTYYDEDGTLHYHDVNTHSSRYWCSNGHVLHRSGKPNCPAPGCGYGDMAWTVSDQ